MEPWQSWGIIGIVGAGAYVYYSQSRKPKRAKGRAPLVAEQNQQRNTKLRDESKGNRKRGDASGASDQITSDVADVSSTSVSKLGKDRVKKRKGDKGQSSLAQSTGVDTSPDVDVVVDTVDADEEMDNKEFARQLSGLKAGTSLKKPDNVGETRRTKKQGKRNELQPGQPNGGVTATNGIVNGIANGMSTASSTTGADADDDLSPAISPALGATQSTQASGDVSDMLEVPTKGPSVFRLTEPAQAQPRQPKTQKKVEEPETKKQRQNRKKNEEKKLAREQAEKERRVLLEKQLRTSREAEGRPAKNGLGPSQAPLSNAWTKSGDVAPTSSSTFNGHGALLDTFDETKNHKGNGTSKDTVWERELPSEEEQLRILNEMEGNDGWNTVAKSGKAKKKAGIPGKIKGENKISNTNGASAEKKNSTPDFGYDGTHDIEPSAGINTSAALGKNPSTASYQGKPKVDPVVWNHSNIHNHPDFNPEFPFALVGHPDDSDWAVV